MKKSDLRLLPSAPDPGLCGDGGKSPTDTGTGDACWTNTVTLPVYLFGEH